MAELTIRRAVVNGALGSVGLALVDCLLGKGIETCAVVYPGDARIALLPKEAAAVPCDMREIARLPELVGGPVDAFFHLAWMGTIGPGRDDMWLQTENIRCALEAAKVSAALGCRVFVGVGSQAEHGRVDGLVRQDTPCFPLTGYGMAKLCAGQMTRSVCGSLGVRHVWARILSVYGPNDSPLSVTSVIIGRLLKGEKPALTAGEQLWDYLYAADAAEGLFRMAASGRDGAVYPLGSGEARPLREYFEMMRDAVNPALPLGLGELPYAPNQVMRLQADIEPLRRDTGFEPKTRFEDGIAETVKGIRKRMAEQ
ncbi:MAG: NAD(P)-dependent oxidoreductase [Clostridia bacterium]|nr:NAD(P)-dependent oxidoreductase [Clostridia bacterium]